MEIIFIGHKESDGLQRILIWKTNHKSVQSHVISEKTKSHLIVRSLGKIVRSISNVCKLGKICFISFFFFAASKSSYHEYYMLLLLEGRFEGSSLKLNHPSRQRICRVFLKSSGYVHWSICLFPNFCSVIIVYLSLGKN